MKKFTEFKEETSGLKSHKAWVNPEANIVIVWDNLSWHHLHKIEKEVPSDYIRNNKWILKAIKKWNDESKDSTWDEDFFEALFKNGWVRIGTLHTAGETEAYFHGNREFISKAGLVLSNWISKLPSSKAKHWNIDTISIENEYTNHRKRAYMSDPRKVELFLKGKMRI